MGRESGQACAVDGVKHYTKLWRSIFNFLKQHWDTFQFRRRFFLFKNERFLPIIGDKYIKSDWSWRIWL